MITIISPLKQQSEYRYQIELNKVWTTYTLYLRIFDSGFISSTPEQPVTDAVEFAAIQKKYCLKTAW